MDYNMDDTYSGMRYENIKKEVDIFEEGELA